METQTPWSHPDRIERLSQAPVGRDLADLVATQLRLDSNKGRGLWNSHRDYCGHGLIFECDEFRLIEVRDGSGRDADVISSWESAEEFVGWLSEQSDYSLAGADPGELNLYTDSPSRLNNQRLSIARLRVYSAAAALPSAYKSFAQALATEFSFLCDDYEYALSPPKLTGATALARYSTAHVAILVTYEPGSTPSISVSKIDADGKLGSIQSLTMLAKQRMSNWAEPSDLTTKSVDELRRWFGKYAFALQVLFRDLLDKQGAGAELESVPEATADQSTVIEGEGLDSENSTEKSDEAVSEFRHRIIGLVVVLAAISVMVAEFRFFALYGGPEAGGGLRSSLGRLILISLPWMVLAAGVIQVASGRTVFEFGRRFPRLGIARKILVSLGLIVIVLAATGLAVRLS